MALMEIIYYGDPRLEKVSEPVLEVTPEIHRLVRDMFETMYFTNGVGLSAPQVGVNKRVLVIDTSGGEDRSKQVVLLNPVVLSQSGEQRGQEGCLSFPGLYASVTRASCVKVSGIGLEGRPVEIEGTDLLARALLHEIDHLDGVLFIQRMKKADREATLKKLKKQPIQKRETVTA